MTTISQLEMDGEEKRRALKKNKENQVRKKIIMIGFIIVAAVVLTVFLLRSGLYIEIIQREERRGNGDITDNISKVIK
jgi:hypothetical protein